jgi:phosphoribosylamine--glycine ligase
MKVLLVGNGGREHALAWRLAQCASVDRIVCPNGNPGISLHADTPSLALNSMAEWAEYARQQRTDLVVIGPEAPLAAGLADECEARGIRVFGPRSAAARLESSKAFAKEIMLAANIPTAQSGTFSDFDQAKKFARSLGLPVVIKADGLAAGKGVAICESWEDVDATLAGHLRDHHFGAASSVVLVEEFLQGEEASLIAITDGEEVWPLSPSQDHKRAYDGDTGPNTGGMGAYAPAPVVSEELLSVCMGEVMRPAVQELGRRGIPFVGVLYAGLMITSDGPRVLEFNCRFGDPECQVLMPLLEGDLAEGMLACAEHRLARHLYRGGSADAHSALGLRPDHAVVVVMASGGYPGKFTTGHVISGLRDSWGNDQIVFQAGTSRREDGTIVTSGGRVLGLTAWGPSLDSTVHRAYDLADGIHFEGARFRRDIAHRALDRK